MRKTTKRIIRIACIAAAAIFLIFNIVHIYTSYTAYVSGVADAEEQIAELRKQILIQEASIDEAESAYSAETADMHSISDVVKEVSSLQTNYQSVETVYTDLQQYFDTADVRQWFDWSDTGLALSWSCVTDYNFSGDSMDVMWICTSSGSMVYAYTTAEYSAATGKFSDVETHLTNAGLSIEEEG